MRRSPLLLLLLLLLLLFPFHYSDVCSSSSLPLLTAIVSVHNTPIHLVHSTDSQTDRHMLPRLPAAPARIAQLRRLPSLSPPLPPRVALSRRRLSAVTAPPKREQIRIPCRSNGAITVEYGLLLFFCVSLLSHRLCMKSLFHCPPCPKPRVWQTTAVR